jgi:hypothetical protein
MSHRSRLSEFEGWGLGVGVEVWGLGFRDQGLGFRSWGADLSRAHTSDNLWLQECLADVFGVEVVGLTEAGS